MSYIPSLRPHSAKSGKQTQWATSDRRILIIPPRLLAPASSLWSPAVGSEDITATRVVLAAARRVGLTAPVRLKEQELREKLHWEEILELTLIQNNWRNLSEVSLLLPRLPQENDEHDMSMK